jgi:hypothetical protein
LEEHPDDQADLVIHSFVIRVWLENPGVEAGGESWRGQITHIPGGERKYFSDLTEIPGFVRLYLKQTGDPTNLPSVVP